MAVHSRTESHWWRRRRRSPHMHSTQVSFCRVLPSALVVKTKCQPGVFKAAVLHMRLCVVAAATLTLHALDAVALPGACGRDDAVADRRGGGRFAVHGVDVSVDFVAAGAVRLRTMTEWVRTVRVRTVRVRRSSCGTAAWSTRVGAHARPAALQRQGRGAEQPAHSPRMCRSTRRSLRQRATRRAVDWVRHRDGRHCENQRLAGQI
jgi:hypothetical protein